MGLDPFFNKAYSNSRKLTQVAITAPTHSAKYSEQQRSTHYTLFYHSTRTLPFTL